MRCFPIALTSVSAVALTALLSCGGAADSPPPTKPAEPKASTPSTPAANSTESSGAEAPAQEEDVKVDRTGAVSLFGGEPAAPKVKANRRLTKGKVALGKKLYHEKALSRNNDISCASCHDLANYGQDGLALSPGTGGAAGKRNTPTVYNAFRQYRQFWDWRAETVAQQATMPILTANEHGLTDDAEIVSILEGIPEYADLFAKAFPKDEKPITADNVRLAIGAFERKLETKSAFDKYLDGDDNALTAAQKRGLNTFMQVGCTTCHTTRLLGGQMAQKLGLVRPYNKSEDYGRFEVTGNAVDKNMFKVPQLLNVAKTAPYLHDGSIATLEEVTKMMGEYQLGRKLSDGQISDLVAFMGSLTGEIPEIAKSE